MKFIVCLIILTAATPLNPFEDVVRSIVHTIFIC